MADAARCEHCGGLPGSPCSLCACRAELDAARLLARLVAEERDAANVSIAQLEAQRAQLQGEAAEARGERDEAKRATATVTEREGALLSALVQIEHVGGHVGVSAAGGMSAESFATYATMMACEALTDHERALASVSVNACQTNATTPESRAAVADIVDAATERLREADLAAGGVPLGPPAPLCTCERAFVSTDATITVLSRNPFCLQHGDRGSYRRG